MTDFTPGPSQRRPNQFMITLAIAGTVRDVHLAPLGPIYSALQSTCPDTTFDEFNSCIEILINAKAVGRQNHQLLWLDHPSWNRVVDTMDKIIEDMKNERSRS